MATEEKKEAHNSPIDLTPEYYDGEYWFTREQVREMERTGTMKEILSKYNKSDDK